MKGHAMANWTEARLARFKELFSGGASFSTIAAALGGFGHTRDGGRSACIGKANRLGLVREGSHAAARRATQVRAAERERIPRGGGNMAARVARQKQIAAMVAGNPEKIAAPVMYDPACRVTFMQLENHHCRYPLWGDDQVADVRFFCGTPEANLHKGIPYCRGHSVIAFNGFSHGRAAPAPKPHIVMEAAE